MSQDPTATIAALVAGAPILARDPVAPSALLDRDPTLAEADEEGPSDLGGEDVDGDIVAACALLDTSDTDNAERLIRHFGQDLAVLSQEGVPGGDWLGWAGTHWDLAGGAARVRLIAQRLGARIGMEAAYLRATPEEVRAIKAAADLRGRPKADLTDDDRERLAAAKTAEAALLRRQAKRRAFGVTSKNQGRMESAIGCAAPRLRRPPEHFNTDKFKVATTTHTLSFVRDRDPECPDPEAERFVVRCDAAPGHCREDWITAVVPVAYAAQADAPRWRAFLNEMLPDPDKRRTVQAFTALGLLSTTAQFVMFHYGLGANGKSVFLETVTRVLGPGLAVGLPRESIVGGSERSAGGASPDLARLYGKRMVRILEVKADLPLQEDLIKRLTGGEAFPVRTLFKGYYEFQNYATPHMSGNGKPTIEGTDSGIWRRMLLVHWDQTVPEGERRDFEEMVSGFVREEGSGILNWMIEGVCDFLVNGLFIAPSVQSSTDEYREDMDPIGAFLTACVRAAPGQNVQAHAMFQAYESWSLANAKRLRSQTKFGRVASQHYRKKEVSGRLYYVDCELHDVPDRPDAAPRNPDGGAPWGGPE